MSTNTKSAERLPSGDADLLRALIEHLPDVVMLIDRACNIRFINYTMPGLTVDQVIGTSVYAYMPEQFHSAYRCLLERAFEERQPGKFDVDSINNSHWQARIVPLVGPQGNVDRVMIIGTDVTDYARSSRLLAAERRVLEQIASGKSLSKVLGTLTQLIEEQLDGGLCTVLIYDQQTHQMRQAAGSSELDAYSRLIDGFTAGPHVGSCGTAAYLNETVIAEDIETDENWSMYKHLAAPYGLRACWSTPIVDADGRVLGTFASYYREPHQPLPHERAIVDRAVSLAGIAIQRRKNEDELANQQARLAQVSRLSVLGEMVAGIAHEITQPLTAIANFAGACRAVLGHDPPLLDEARDYVHEIRTQSIRAGKIVQSLRALARRTEGEREECELATLMRDCLDLVRGDVRRSQARVQFDADDAAAVVSVDRVQMQTVIVNLVRNACEAMQPQPADRRTILLRIAVQNDAAVVECHDTGPGLPSTGVEQIFHAFHTTKPEGMGMGLAICRSIIESHGGRISAFNNDSGGATFRVLLPLAETSGTPVAVVGTASPVS